MWCLDTSNVATAYISERTGGLWYGDQTWGLVFIEDEAIHGAVLYHDFDGISLWFSLALTPRARITRASLRAWVDYGFHTLGARRISFRNSVHNTEAHKMCRAMGCTLEGTTRRSAPNGDDEHIWGLLEGECRLLKRGAPTHGRPFASSSPAH